MYKLIAADDEVMELEFIKFCLANSKLPVQLVGTAADGAEAIKLVDQVDPAIVILDIKMPRISGIDVGRHIAENHPRAKVIMLTAYDKFDFACEALRFHAFDYLLKPVRPEQLLAVLEKAIEAIKREEERVKRQESLLRDLKPAVIQKAVTSLITVGRWDLPVLPGEQFSLLDRSLRKSGQLLIGCLALWRGDGTPVTDPVCLEKVMGRLNADFSYGLFVMSEGTDKLIFCSERSGLSYAKLRQIESLVKELGYQAVLVIKKVERLSKAPKVFQDANRHCDYHAFWGQAGVYVADGDYVKPAWQMKPLRQATGDMLKKYFTESSSDLRDETDQILMSLFEQVKSSKPDPKGCKNYFEELVAIIAWQFIEKKIEVEQVEALKLETIEKIQQARNYLGVFSATQAFNHRIIDILLKPDPSNAEQTVRWIKNYLHANYRDNITLEHLAEKVYLSPCYISRIFRQNTGASFLQYLTSIRMERAYEMLQTGKYSVGEVAEAVGYKDASYFSQVFRRKYGVCPHEVIRFRGNMTNSQG